jgi:hypothetical protein
MVPLLMRWLARPSSTCLGFGKVVPIATRPQVDNWKRLIHRCIGMGVEVRKRRRRKAKKAKKKHPQILSWKCSCLCRNCLPYRHCLLVCFLPMFASIALAYCAELNHFFSPSNWSSIRGRQVRLIPCPDLEVCTTPLRRSSPLWVFFLLLFFCISSTSTTQSSPSPQVPEERKKEKSRPKKTIAQRNCNCALGINHPKAKSP